MNLYTNNIYYIPKYTPTFNGSNPKAKSEAGVGKFEYALRVVGNKTRDIFEPKQTKEITRNISQITPHSSELYLQQLNEISRLYSTSKTIDVNIEDGVLEDVAKSDKATIFIMSHSNQKEDPSMLAVLNALLTQAYKDAGKGDSFPLPKIILNQDILTSMNPIRRKAFEAFGAVGIDATVNGGDKGVNTQAFLPVIRDFIQDKCNIFIFPEGKLAIRKDMDLESRFQPGIAELINKVLKIKKEVNVVPVGFAYGQKELKDLTGMHIGTPVTFKRADGITTVTKGSILSSEYAFDGFKNFFEKHQDESDIVITKGGKPVDIKEVTGYIKSILSENLNICSKEAEAKIHP